MVKNGEKKGYTAGMEEAPQNGKKSSHSAHVNGMNERMNMFQSLLLS
jgi:hypothetical protein